MTVEQVIDAAADLPQGGRGIQRRMTNKHGVTFDVIVTVGKPWETQGGGRAALLTLYVYPESKLGSRSGYGSLAGSLRWKSKDWHNSEPREWVVDPSTGPILARHETDPWGAVQAYIDHLSPAVVSHLWEGDISDEPDTCYSCGLPAKPDDRLVADFFGLIHERCAP